MINRNKESNQIIQVSNFLAVLAGYIGEFEIIDDHRGGKIVVHLNGRLNKVCIGMFSPSQVSASDVSEKKGRFIML